MPTEIKKRVARNLRHLGEHQLSSVRRWVVRTRVSEHDMRFVSPVVAVDDDTKLQPFEVSMPADYREPHRRRLVGVVDAALRAIGLDPPADLSAAIEEYEELDRENPGAGLGGSTAYNSRLWLFLVVRCLKPRVVVESGVFVGASLWTLRRAAPDARLVAFDTSLKKLTFTDPSIELVEDDWTTTDIRAEGPTDLCYFDDHVDNAQRMLQAHERGFRHIVFDDCPGVATLCHYRYPGVPTARMVMDTDLRDGQVFTWQRDGLSLQYTYDAADAQRARKLVTELHEFPSLRPYTGRTGGQDLAYLTLE